MIEDYNDIIKKYNPEKNITNNILSKYEKVKIIGIRAEQIQRGASPLINVDTTGEISPIEIAKEELKQRKLPFMVCRKLPNGNNEYWKLDDMIVINH